MALSENVLSLVTQNTNCGCVDLPCNMWTGIHKDRLKVFGEFWAFLLAVLDDIIGQIQKCQLPVAFSWDTIFKKCGGKDVRMHFKSPCNQYIFGEHVQNVHPLRFLFLHHYLTNKMHIYILAFSWIASVIANITFFQLLVPHFNNKGRMFTVVNDPERQGLDALLGAAELRQLLLQSRLREGRHAAVCVCVSPLWTRMSSDLLQSFRHQNWSCAANFDTCKRILLLMLLWLSGWEKQTPKE